MNGRALLTAALATLLLGACGARAEQVGSVDTVGSEGRRVGKECWV